MEKTSLQDLEKESQCPEDVSSGSISEDEVKEVKGYLNVDKGDKQTKSFMVKLAMDNVRKTLPPTYELEKFKKNVLLIFNQEHFDNEELETRFGTDKDVEALTQTFEPFGFDVITLNDLGKDEIFRELEAFSNTDFTDYGCIAVAVLTHGSTDGLLWAQDHQYKEEDMARYFQVHDNPSLVLKPKILIIQSCRGSQMNEAVPVFERQIKTYHIEEMTPEPHFLPDMADILVVHSSYTGYPSYRVKQKGTWFIQSLCSKINQLAETHDFESIMTEMKREVAIEKEHYRGSVAFKQMPVSTSTLLRRLYLKKFDEEVNNDGETASANRGALDVSPQAAFESQSESCSCFLKHFDYIKDCLSHYVEENKDDATAKRFLMVAQSFLDTNDFHELKKVMTKTICEHLLRSSKDFKYSEYLHIYK